MIKEQLGRYKTEIKESIEDLKTKGRRRKQIPNILTSLRLLAPFFILPAAFVGNVVLVFAFVGTFSLTDLLDGFIARKFHFTSNLGRDLDAFCDKIFAGTLLLASSFINPMLLVNFGLEVAIASTNTKAKLEGMDARSLLIGKVKTFFLFPLIGVSFISNHLPIELLLPAGVALTAGLQTVTLMAYQRKYRRNRQEKKQQEALQKECDSILAEEGESIELEKSKKQDFRLTVLGEREARIDALKQAREILIEEVGFKISEQPEKTRELSKKKEI